MTHMFYDRPERAEAPVSERVSRLPVASAGFVAAPIDDVVDRYLRDAAGAAIVLRRSLQVVRTNSAGRNFFGAGAGQYLNLHWVSPVSVSRVRQFLAGKAKGNLPVRINQTGQGARLALASVLATDRPDMDLIGIRRLSMVWQAQTDDILHDAFDLTSAEVDICRLIFGGCNPDEIARLRDASLKTVRTQLSMAFQKTETSGQVELALLLAQIAGMEQSNS